MFLILYKDSSNLTAAFKIANNQNNSKQHQVKIQDEEPIMEDELTVPPYTINEPTERREEQPVPRTMLECVLELAASEAVLRVKEPRHPDLRKQTNGGREAKTN
jgi:hypothetical protein